MNSPAPSTPPACLGLIVPPREGEVPGDGPALYGGRARFLARGLGLGEISPRGYEEVIDRVVGLAVELGQAGASAVSLMGTSLSFFRGAAFNAELEAEMARRTGLPCTTMSHAIVRGLAAVGVRRVAVATAYIATSTGAWPTTWRPATSSPPTCAAWRSPACAKSAKCRRRPWSRSARRPSPPRPAPRAS